MRKDVKRSLVLWPLSASIFVTGLCWLAMQADPASRLLVATANQWWMEATQTTAVAPERTSSPVNTDIHVRQVTAGDGGSERTAAASLAINPSGESGSRSADQSVSIRLRSEQEALDELAGIQEWNDTSFELAGSEIVGIPAPSLNSESDLFGFDPYSIRSSVSGETNNLIDEATPVLALTPPAENGVEVDLSVGRVAADNELVIQIDPDVFFADDEPISAKAGASHPTATAELNLSSPQLAERPTSDITLPSTYVPPASVVADLAPDLDVNETVRESLHKNSLDAMQKLPDPVRDSASETGDASLADTQDVVESPAQEKAEKDVRADSSRDLAPARSAAWPIAKQLLGQLDVLESIVQQTTDEATVSVGDLNLVSEQELLAWSAEVRQLLGQLPTATRLGDAKVADMMDRLGELQEHALIRAETLDSRSRRVAWLQAAYSIQRRLAVWRPIYRINSGHFPAPQHVGDDVKSVSEAIAQLEMQLPITRDVDGWTKFLLLEELREVFQSGEDSARAEVAQKFLARLSWPNLDPLHKEFLAEPVVNDVAVAVKPWASGAIDYSALLHQIERAEANAIDLVTAEVAHSMQSLEHANHPQAKQLAKNIDTYYRNANVRFSLSDELLQHLLPEIPTRDVPVRMTMLGSRVTGVSSVSSDLAIRLIPSNSSWELALETAGNVSTRSVGRRGPAAVRTSSVNPYSASMPISIKPSDVQLGSSAVSVGGRSRLKGIRTNYDGWPLVGSLVRNIAESEYFDKAALANRIGRSRIQSQLGEEIDQTINDKVDEASGQFSKTILGPLTDLQLEPRVIDMGSTDSRLIARYRMAGRRQLAAMTPRPRALAGNLFSVQLHQSAINNTLEQLVPQNEMLPITEVMQQCFEVLGVERFEAPEDLPEDALIQFAKHRPITIEIEDGKVWVTMRIIRLQNGKSVKLRNFIVRAAYKPEINGLSASLVRDGHLSISGPRMSMRQRFPVRAIFNKVLSPNRPLPLTSEELLVKRMPEQSGITQFELRDGWLGVSVGKMVENQAIASRPRGIR